MRKRRLDPKVIRVGDVVRILNDRPIERIGYPKAVKDYYEDIEKEAGGQLDLLITLAEGLKEDGVRYYEPSHQSKGVRKLIIHNLAYLRAKRDGFGGRQKQIFWGEPRKREGRLARVVSVCMKQTGEYYAPYSSYSYYGEYDYEPGGLAKCQQHKILGLSLLSKVNEMLEDDWEDCQDFEFAIAPYKQQYPLQLLASDCEKVFEKLSTNT